MLDKSLIINIKLVASCWFLSLHPTLRNLATGSTYKDVKFSFWICLLLSRKIVTEWILSNIVHSLSYIFEIE